MAKKTTSEYTREEFIQFFTHCCGNYASTAEALGVTRKNVVDRVQSDPELQEIRNDFIEARIDKAESVVDKALDADDATTARWVLGTAGKDRGWAGRTEITDPNGEPLHTGAIDRLAAIINKLHDRAEDGEVSQVEQS